MSTYARIHQLKKCLSAHPLPWMSFLAELAGTALLILVGLSFVILDFGQGSFIVQLLPNDGVRRLITGFLFGSTGALIAISPLGKESGAHINPVVSFSFWLMGKFPGRYAAGYMIAQMTGAVIGALPLFAWGAIGSSVDFGATLNTEHWQHWQEKLSRLLHWLQVYSFLSEIAKFGTSLPLCFLYCMLSWFFLRHLFRAPAPILPAVSVQP